MRQIAQAMLAAAFAWATPACATTIPVHEIAALPGSAHLVARPFHWFRCRPAQNIGEVKSPTIRVGETYPIGDLRFTVYSIEADPFEADVRVHGHLYARKGDLVCIAYGRGAEAVCGEGWIYVHNCTVLRR